MKVEGYQGYAPGQGSLAMLELPSVLAAVTAADPYPFYEELRKRRPFGWDEELGAWVAADAAAVREVLKSSAGGYGRGRAGAGRAGRLARR